MTMKKIYALGAMLAATFTLTNCTEEVHSPVESDNVPYTIQANTADTKTVNEGFSTVWIEGDALSVFHAAAGTADYSGNSKFVLSDTGDGLFETSALDGELSASNDWYVFYPYTRALTTPAGCEEGSLTIGSKVDYAQNQIGNDSMDHIAGVNYPLWGVAKNVSGNELPAVGMNQMTALVEVEVTNATGSDLTVSTVALTGTEPLVGTYSVDLTGESPVISASDGQNVSYTAKLDVARGEAIEAGKAAKFYFSVKPFTAPAGQSLVLSVNGIEKKLDLTADVTFAPGKVKTLKFAMDALKPGGEISVSAGEFKARQNEIEVELTAAGAARIYYSFLTNAEARKYSTDELKAGYLLSSGKEAAGETAVAKASEVLKSIKENTKYTFIAMAVDPQGNYGQVLSIDCKTNPIVYNDLEVSLAIETNAPGNVVVTVSADGAEDYLYWIGKTSDNTWKSLNYLGKSAAKAEKYMYMHTEDDLFGKVMAKYPVTGDKVIMDDLEIGKEYVIVMMAKDKEGLYSHATALLFTPNAFSLGNVVMSTDPKWEEARPTVEFLRETFEASSGFLPGRYAFTVLIPEGFTAYVLAGAEGYFNGGDETVVVSAEDKIVGVIENVDRSSFYEKVIDIDLYKEKGYPYGHEFYQYRHGAPGKGYGVIWANRDYHDHYGANGEPCDCMDVEYVEKTYQWSDPPATYRVYNAIHMNDDEAEAFVQGSANGSKTEVIDIVYIVCKDLEGNCYQTFEFEVPFEYFANSTPPQE